MSADTPDEMPEWLEAAHESTGLELLKDSNTDVRIHRDAKNNETVAVLRTSDRISFKRCRRRWGWSSHLRHNLGPKLAQSPLWFGSGIHFALEDFHGYNRYKDPVTAFKAYVRATHTKDANALPEDWKELEELGIGMMEYYLLWLRGRDPLQTYWEDGKPQVEVNFKIPVPFDATRWGIDRVVYSGQLDRVAIDEHGRLWIVEYKTAKIVQTLHYLTDPQITTYMWAGNHIYERELAGVVYQQHRKSTPEKPTPLARGGISIAKNQKTTHRMYRQALLTYYGDISKVPAANIEFLNTMALTEGSEHDPFIRRDRVYRNDTMGIAEAQKILMECEDMLNPDLPLYPNPTRDCQFMCPFVGACVSMDDGSDWQTELDAGFVYRDAVYDRWRKYLPAPAGEIEAPYSFDFEADASGTFTMEPEINDE